MNKKLISCIAVCLSFFCAFAQQTNNSSLFIFQRNSEILVDVYKDNQSELEKLGHLISTHKQGLLNGQYHLVITSFIKPEYTKDIYALNMAAIQGSVVRAYAKIKYRLTNDAFIFTINNSQRVDNTVLVEFISSPIAESANRNICYTKSRDPEIIATVVLGCNALRSNSSTIGASNEDKKLSENDINWISKIQKSTDGYKETVSSGQMSGKSEQIIATPTPSGQMSGKSEQIAAVPTPSGQVSGKSEQIAAVPTPSEQMSVPSVSASADQVAVTPTPVTSDQKMEETLHNELQGRQTSSISDSLLPHSTVMIGMRTNLFYWLLLQPNLGVDFHVGNRLSLHFEGMYSKWTNYSKGKNYAANMGSLEIRYWIKPNKGAFTGHHIGAYGHIGQYDLKFSQTGYTGDYYGGGVSYGYTMPLKKKLFLEFGVRAGVIDTSYDTYIYEEPEYYYQQSKRSAYWGITGASISLIYRFGR